MYERGVRKWHLLEVRGGLPVSANNTSPKYEIYAESTELNFLINTETGQSWALFNTTWYPITD